MTGLLDGTTVPWHIVSGKTEPSVAVSLPPPVVRDVVWSETAMGEMQTQTIGWMVAVRAAGIAAANSMRRFADAFKDALPQENE